MLQCTLYNCDHLARMKHYIWTERQWFFPTPQSPTASHHIFIIEIEFN